jgi:hypothetical protein
MRARFLAVVAGLASLVFAVTGGVALAERRVALVIGNAAYQNATPLANTSNDAKAMAALFNKAGFDVVESRGNLGVVEFKRAIRDFMHTARDADIAVVYFAGHGIEVRGSNYLVPVDAKLQSDYDADDEAISLDRVMLAVEPVKQLRLIILDACRDNPFIRRMQRTMATRAVNGGLASVEPSTGNTLVAYAAQGGMFSYDGSGPNSPFTTALVKHIAEPGLDIRIALGRVRDEVKKITGNRQEPVVYGSLGGTTIALVRGPAAESPELAAPRREMQRDYEFAERVGTREAWESFLQAHGSGYYAGLARAQLAKLNETAGKATPPVVIAATKPDSADAGAAAKKGLTLGGAQQQQARVDPNPPAAAGGAAEQRLAPALAVAPAIVVDPCKAEQEKLIRLRADPTRDEIVRLERELSCEKLRAQVVRLRESVIGALPAGEAGKPGSSGPAAAAPGGAPGRESASAAPPRPGNEAKRPAAEPEAAQRRPEDGAAVAAGRDACERDQERLARLRSGPTREEVLRFERELACDRLRPQVLRLRESVMFE